MTALFILREYIDQDCANSGVNLKRNPLLSSSHFCNNLISVILVSVHHLLLWPTLNCGTQFVGYHVATYSSSQASPRLLALSPLVFQCRSLEGWEGLRFVLCMLWSVQSLPAALRVEEMRDGWREEGGQGGGQTRLAQYPTTQPTPSAWLEANPYQMPDVSHYS